MAVILLGCVAMELGVRFSDEDMLVVKMCVMRDSKKGEGGGFLKEGTRRMEVLEALQGYGNDGERWVFRRDDNSSEAAGNANSGKAKKQQQQQQQRQAMEMKEMKALIQQVEKEVKHGAKPPLHPSKYANPHHKPSTPKKPRASKKPHEPTTTTTGDKPASKAQHRASWFPSPTRDKSQLSFSSDEHDIKENVLTSPVKEEEDTSVGTESCYRLPCPKAAVKQKAMWEKEVEDKKEKENQKKVNRKSV
ncbi:MAG: hypothetical protein L6R39_007720 [Caloplaca ligustica]|nr:MAG: hypothetical protein L6R39_007720 [Caloplaca ligustica]